VYMLCVVQDETETTTTTTTTTTSVSSCITHSIYTTMDLT